jgi:hypothetical protein
MRRKEIVGLSQVVFKFISQMRYVMRSEYCNLTTLRPLESVFCSLNGRYWDQVNNVVILICMIYLRRIPEGVDFDGLDIGWLSVN